MGYTANLGGMIRHTEIRPEAVGAGEDYGKVRAGLHIGNDEPRGDVER